MVVSIRQVQLLSMFHISLANSVQHFPTLTAQPVAITRQRDDLFHEQSQKNSAASV